MTISRHGVYDELHTGDKVAESHSRPTREQRTQAEGCDAGICNDDPYILERIARCILSLTKPTSWFSSVLYAQSDCRLETVLFHIE